MLPFLHYLSFILFVSAKKTCDLTPSYEKVKNIINYLQVHCVSVPMLYVVPRKISQVPKLQCIHHVCCQGRETSSTFWKILLQPFSEHQFLLLCPVCLQSPDEKPCQGHSLRQVQISLKDKHIFIRTPWFPESINWIVLIKSQRDHQQSSTLISVFVSFCCFLAKEW